MNAAAVTSEPRHQRNHRSWLFPLALAAVIFAVFWPVRLNEFINYDDPYYVTSNPEVQKGVTKEGIAWAFGQLTGRGTYWHPVTWLSHMLDCQLFGLNAGAHHLVSAIIHSLNAVLVFLLFKKLTGAFWRSGILALLFALHPMQAESVAWAAERKNVLSTFFGLLSIGFYVRYVQGFKVRGSTPTSRERAFKVNYILALLSFALSLMSKPMLVTLPFILLLLDFWPLARISTSNLKLQTSNIAKLSAEKLPFLILSAISCYITIAAHRNLDLIASIAELSWISRLTNTVIAYGLYLWKTFWPVHLAVYYPLPLAWPRSQIISSVLLLISVSMIALLTVRKRPWFLFGWLWFLGTLVPVIGVVQVGSQSIANRYNYVPVIGLLVGVIWLCGEIAARGKKSRILGMAVTVALIFGCIAGTKVQLDHWKNSVTLFRHALAVTRQNHVAHINLAAALTDNDDEAAIHYQAALDAGSNVPEARFGLARIFERKQFFNRAAEQYAAIVALDPKNAFALNNLGAAEEKLGQLDDALAHYRAAVKADPKYALARHNLAGLLLRSNKIKEAIPHLEEVLRVRPDNAGARNNLGVAFAALGELENAAEQFREALRVNPNDADARRNLNLILTKLEKTDTNEKDKSPASKPEK